MRKLLFILIMSIGINAAKAAPILPDLPDPFTATLPSGWDGPADVVLTAADDLQQAINNAPQNGDGLYIIELTAGDTWTGSYSLPNNQNGQDWILIRSSNFSILPSGRRVTPADTPNMPRLLRTVKQGNHIDTDPGAHNFWFLGIHFESTYAGTDILFNRIRIDEGADKIVIDRCYLHANEEGNNFDGIVGASAKSMAVIDSRIEGFHVAENAPQSEGHAILLIQMEGPVLIQNNHLEADGENIMTGGTSASGLNENQVTNDLTIRGNYFFKPLSWRDPIPSGPNQGVKWRVKNLLEFKEGHRILVEGNIFENNWAAKQGGQAIVVTSRDGVINHLTFRRNVVLLDATNENSAIGGNPAADDLTNFLIEDNVFYGYGPGTVNNTPRLFNFGRGSGNPLSNLIIRHNTGVGSGYFMRFNSGQKPSIDGMHVYDNVGSFGGGIAGINYIDEWVNNYDWDTNLLIGGSNMPQNANLRNFMYEPTNSDVGFADTTFDDIEDFRLMNAPYKGGATDGKDMGADIDAILSATQCARFGNCDGTPQPPTSYLLTVNNGTGDGSFAAGSVRNILANAPPTGQEFDKWTGNTSHVADVNAADTTVTMPASNVSVTATYKNIQNPDGYPELPRFYVNTDFDPAYDRSADIQVRNDCTGAPSPCYTNFQIALNDVLPGQIIELKAGDTFLGDFVLKNKSGNEWIYIRSSRYQDLPSPGTRVNPHAPASHDNLMPKLVGANVGNPWSVSSEFSAHHYRLIGIEITKSPGASNRDLVRLGLNVGSGNATSVDQLPHHIIFDRCYIHSTPNDSAQIGIRLDGMYMAVIDSYISEIKAVADAQAILALNGAGPFKIVNNYLESTGENILFGGGDPSIPNLIPSDAEIRGNLFAKPESWRNSSWGIKNLFELKNAQRLLIDGNIFEKNWAAAQDGSAIVIKSANQDGSAPWSVSRDVTFTNNIIRHSASGIRISGRGGPHPAGKTSRILISNNLMYDINSSNWGGSGRPWEFTNDFADIYVIHNTVENLGSHFMVAEGPSASGFIYNNNLATNINTYGIKGSGQVAGTATLEAYYPGYEFRHNVLVGANPSSYPPTSPPESNHYPTSVNTIGFANLAFSKVNDFRLVTGPYRGMATDGTDIGVDIDALIAATQCVEAGTCNPPPIDPPNPGPGPGPNPDPPVQVPDPEDSVTIDFDKFINRASADNGYIIEIPCDSNVDIYMKMGSLVKSLTCSGDKAVWNANEFAAGVYIVQRAGREPRKVVVVK